MDNHLALDTLQLRVDRLERQNRWLKRGGAVLLASLALMGVMGQAMPKSVPKVIEAGSIILRDANGSVRGLLQVQSSEMSLSFTDDKGTTRALLSINATGSFLTLLHPNGKGQVGLHADTGLGTGVVLWDQDHKQRVRLDVDSSGPAVVLLDENTKVRAVLGHSELETTTTGTVVHRPASSLVLFDKNGKVLREIP